MIKQKRGQSKIITVVLLILLILALIVILWNLIIGLLKESQFNVELEQEVSKIRLNIEDADCLDNLGDEVDCVGGGAETINLAIQRSGSGNIVIGHENVSRTIYENRSYTVPINNPYTITVNNPYTITVTETETIIRPLDIVFVVDTTGSMGDEIADVRNTITAFANTADNSLNASFKNRFSLIDYKDYPTSSCGNAEDYPSKIHTFNGNTTTEDVTIFKNEVNTLSHKGGGDGPESALNGLQDAINLPFRFKKIIILLADAPPHAKDCECSITNPYSYCTNYPQDSNGDGKYDTYIATAQPAPNCYQGPETIEGIRQQLVAQNASFYYINKAPIVSSPSYTLVSTCSNLKDKQMADELGKFYPYAESGSVTNVDEILLEISQTISKEVNYTYDNLTNVSVDNYTTITVDNYTNETRWELVPVITEEEEWNKLIVRFYNDDGDNCKVDITNPPKISEKKNYNLPLCIQDPTLLKIYFVLSDGSEKLITGGEKCLVPGSSQCD